MCRISKFSNYYVISILIFFQVQNWDRWDSQQGRDSCLKINKYYGIFKISNFKISSNLTIPNWLMTRQKHKCTFTLICTQENTVGCPIASIIHDWHIICAYIHLMRALAQLIYLSINNVEFKWIHMWGLRNNIFPVDTFTSKHFKFLSLKAEKKVWKLQYRAGHMHVDKSYSYIYKIQSRIFWKYIFKRRKKGTWKKTLRTFWEQGGQRRPLDQRSVILSLIYKYRI